MKQKIPVPNRSVHQLIKEEGLIEAMTRLHCNEKLSFISPDYIIGENTQIYYFVNIFGKGRIGKNCIISSYTEIQNGVSIGNNCRVGSHSFLCSGVTLEDNSFLGSGIITINDHFPKPHNKNYKQLETVIKKGSSIGSGTVIMGNITIGENSVIGAKSLITKNIPDNEVWYGHPAKFVRKIC